MASSVELLRELLLHLRNCVTIVDIEVFPGTGENTDVDEEAAKEAPFKFHCKRECECMAMCDLGKGCTHAAWNKEELSEGPTFWKA